MRRETTPPSQHGLSLIELMVALTLGLMITSSLGYILLGSRSTYRTQDASARVQDTGRFALEFIGRQLRSAGRVDITPLASDPRTKQVGLPENWTPIAGTHGAVAVGDDGVAVNPNGAVSINGGTRQTDTLTVQYQLTNLTGTVVCEKDKTKQGGRIADANSGTKAPLSNSLLPIPGTGTSCGPCGDEQCSYGTIINTISVNGNTLELRVEGNGGGGAQPISEGVEDLKIRYAESATPSVFNAVPTDLANVVAVQVCIMVRSLDNGVVNTPQQIRDCAGNLYTPNDTRLRRTFTSVFTLRNRVNAVP